MHDRQARTQSRAAQNPGRRGDRCLMSRELTGARGAGVAVGAARGDRAERRSIKYAGVTAAGEQG
jgi:hypothetical protein